MSKLLKATKKITAVAASTLLLSSATFSAGLNDYGSNFVKDSKFVGQVVVGSSAGADDMTAANLIVNQLKAKYSGSEDSYTLSYTKSEGKSSGTANLGTDELTYGTNLSSEVTELDSEDLSFLKQDMVVKLESNSEIKFDETLILSKGENGAKLKFDWNSDLEAAGYKGSNPVAFVDLNSEPLYVLKAEFESGLRFVDSSGATSGDSLKKDSIRGQSIKLFGREFVFANKNTKSSDIKLFTSANTISLTTIGDQDTASIEVEGKSFVVKVIEANEDSQEALISVNGVNGYVKTDDSTDIAGLNVFVKKVFVGNTIVASGKKTLALELFVGGSEITIPKGALTKFVNLKVADEELKNYYVKVDSTNTSEFSEISAIKFAFKPQEGENAMDVVTEGKVLQDPFFKEVSFKFEGYSPKIGTGDNQVKFDVSSDKGTLKFTPVGSSNEVTLNLASINVVNASNTTQNELELYNSNLETFKVFNTSLVAKAAADIDTINKINTSKKYSDIKTTGLTTVSGNAVSVIVTKFGLAVPHADLTGNPLRKVLNELTAKLAETYLLVEGDVFILNEKSGTIDEESESGIFRVESFDGDVVDTDATVSIKNLVTGTTKTYKKSDNVNKAKVMAFYGAGSSAGSFTTGGSDVVSTDTTSKVSSFSLNTNTLSTLVSKGGLKIEIGEVASNELVVTTTEFAGDRDLLSAANPVGTVKYSLNTAKDEVKVAFTGATKTNTVDNNLEDIKTFITNIGTYVKVNSEDDSTSVTFNVPNTQRVFSAMITSGVSSSSKTETVLASAKDARMKELKAKYGSVSATKNSNKNVEFTVTAPVKDSEATAKDNIVVGGPMVNSKAVSLLNGAQTLVKGEAMVKYFSASNSILAYGYTKAGTLEAVKSLNSGATNGAKITVKE